MSLYYARTVKAIFFFMMVSVSIATSASGIFIVKGGSNQAYNDATSGFLQMAYSLQLPDFQAQAIELKKNGSDTATLRVLKSKNPDLVYTVGRYATKSVRKILPDTWIVYSMVLYPEVDGFLNDPKMVGVSSFGSAKSLYDAVKSFGRKYKSLVVINSPVTQKTVGRLLIQLNKAGFNAEGRSVMDASNLKAAFHGLGKKFSTVMILPDPLTQRPEALRFMISQCIEKKYLLVSLTDSLASRGVLCASFLSPINAGNLAARTAKDIIDSGKLPPGRLVEPQESPLAINMTTLSALGLKKPKGLKFEVSYE